MSRAEYTMTTFTPAEAERVTGVSTALQRDWRRHGYLPAGEGHARFNGFDLAEMWALKLLSDRGIGPQQGCDVADWLSGGIMMHALQHRHAYEGDSAALQDLRDVEAPEDLARHVEAAAEKARPGEQYSLGSAPMSWLAMTNKLARAVLRKHGRPKGIGRVLPARFFVWFADGTHRWDESIDACFSGAKRATTGAVVVLDQFALGKALVENAGRPLVYVEDEDDSRSRVIDG